ncbi:MAG: LysR family transcriptional regulator [Rhodospirillaceae bacterium]|nr:LysR family transcriptional regulator [Rhodospirillaceae bacterium]
MSSVKLDRLRFFVALAQEGHFGRAAKRLNITQPTLSRQIQVLEAEIGTQLVLRARGGRRFELTPAGLQLLQDAEMFLEQGERAIGRARRAATGEAGHLSIGHVQDFLCGLLPRLIARFQTAFPQVLMESRQAMSSELVQALRIGEIDIAFVTRPLAYPTGDLREHQLKPTRFLAVLPEVHELASKPSVKLSELASERFVLPGRKIWTGYHYHVARLFTQARFEPKAVITGDNVMLCTLVAEGAGIGLATHDSLIGLPNGVVTVPLEEANAELDRSALWRTANPSRQLVNFVEML